MVLILQIIYQFTGKHFLHRHKEFVKKNYPNLQVTILNNSEELLIHQETDECQLEVDVNKQWQDPKLILNHMVEIERSQISQRRKLAATGSVYLTVSSKRANWKCSFLGLPLSLEEKKDWLMDQLFEHSKKEGKNKESTDVNEIIRIKCRNLINAQIGIKPVCIIH